MILESMLQRLFASLVNGPSMNARPHRSRQRCDWMELAKLHSVAPASALATLLEKRKLEFPARVPAFVAPPYPEAEWSDEQKQARDDHQAQARLLKKLRGIADDAIEYMNDHGESCLALGFPLLSLPPSSDDGLGRASSRILAPLLLMPIELQVRTGSRSGITITCAGEGADLMVANPALVAWLERQTGRSLGDIFLDEEGLDPWREVSELLHQIHTLLDQTTVLDFRPETLLEPVPATSEKLPQGTAMLPSAVLGLFPLSNQALLRDTRWMMENQATLQEPTSAFLNPKALQVQEDAPDMAAPEIEDANGQKRDFTAEWLVSNADPCQAHAVMASREARAMVVHGPPGTGKSQTITNMIADHLARGERVLFVCDKRTALDVVKYRLDAVGLGDLCGVVHDPSSDRKDFYMGLRAKLENLADAPPASDPREQLDQINTQLAAIHTELQGFHQKLHYPLEDKPGSATFHELTGQWLAYAAASGLPEMEPLPHLRPEDITAVSTTLSEICLRADKAGYSKNPFKDLLGISLTNWLSQSSQETRSMLESLGSLAMAADAEKPLHLLTTIQSDGPLPAQAQLRSETAAHLDLLLTEHNPELLQRILSMPTARLHEWRGHCPEAEAYLEQMQECPLDRAHLAGAQSAGLVSLATANLHSVALTAWGEVAGSFFKRLFAGSTKTAAVAALTPLGLGLNEWAKGLSFYKGVKTRLLLLDWLDRLLENATPTTSLPEDSLLRPQAVHSIAALRAQANLILLDSRISLADTFRDVARLKQLSTALAQEARWATSLHALCTKVSSCGLFSSTAAQQLLLRWLGDEAATDTAERWKSHASTLEDMVRLQHSLSQLPSPLGEVTKALIADGASQESLLAALGWRATENVLRQRLKADPELAAIDGGRIEAAFELFLRLSQSKPKLVSNYIRFLWLHHQKNRLLASTGTQLNKHGSSLRQRLYVRGKKALKLRQMLATGEDSEGGDPIYDLCPVWMASPSTVAQIFPRQPIFDVVIFDEASQCRLEEALPVLLRAHRVVIAGDQKQLPPTRFFESALSDSSDSDAETAEELFYQQQQDAEDLLTAALNLDVREAYLDVHYRSRNEALIGFSNEHFYGSRLLPIPGHPRNKALDTPIQLHRVDGEYEERSNKKEAEAAVNLIDELLRDENPPSIGVACFNLTQRDTIIEAIAERLAKDSGFARRYETARERQGRDSFEGLFVKNLENVQGDERDVMIISTTFGRDPAGKFRRNFGVLSQREGGRRLNVLVTRARSAVHVLTSIPSEEYKTLPEVPPGHVPNGRLQLYAYLRYAEDLARHFATHQDELEKMRQDAKPELKHGETATPSSLAKALGQTLLRSHAVGSHIHWGNDGFCVDVACIHPLMPADVTVGVLTDFSRYHKTPDPIEWDIFRTMILSDQGWEFQRVWSPVLFRRLEELVTQIKEAHDQRSSPTAARAFQS